MPYINEAVFALQEGIATREDLDKIMKLGTNVPMGPLTLVDFIGLDTCLGEMFSLVVLVFIFFPQIGPEPQRFLSMKRVDEKLLEQIFSGKMPLALQSCAHRPMGEIRYVSEETNSSCSRRKSSVASAFSGEQGDHQKSPLMYQPVPQHNARPSRRAGRQQVQAVLQRNVQ